MPEARRPLEAILLLRELTSLPGHSFWTDDVSVARSEWVEADRLTGHGQVTDAHLVALAVQNQGRLVTFDRGVSEVIPGSLDPWDVLVLLA